MNMAYEFTIISFCLLTVMNPCLCSHFSYYRHQDQTDILNISIPPDSTGVYIYDTKISILPARAFVTLDQLEYLSLSRNKIHTIHQDAFLGLGQLESLYLDANEITALTGNVFTILGNLKRLRLSRNKIQTIHREAFLGLGKLESLDLSSNAIKVVLGGYH